ncbi:MAG: hypothetical protein LBK63_13420 [Treponema sp.]|jgi:hypothetical protein|nr:hypothetical protein [Treponema sp.]
MKKQIWLLALLPGLLYMACQLETPERTQDARFVRQTNEPNCGGFTTVYYEWLKEGKYGSANEAADKLVVSGVYNQIRFGDSYSSIFSGLENGSNPAKIMKYLKDNVGDPGLFYLDPDNTEFQGINQAIQTIDSDLWNELEGNVRNEVIPDLKPFQYAIGIYSVFNSVEHLQTQQLDGLHYLLFHHNGELLVAYNPWDGYPKPAYYEQLIQKEPIVHNGRILVPTGSGILLP